jgi:hypothetical protein
MKTRLFFASTLAALLLLPALRGSAQERPLPTIELVETFDLPGDTAMPHAINLRGDIVGSTSKVVQHMYVNYSFARGRAGSIARFSFGDLSTYAQGINASRTICGYYYDATSALHGFFLTDGVYTTYDVLGDRQTTLSGLNDVGDVTGTYTASEYQDTPFLTRDGTVVPIDLGFDTRYTKPSAISSDGRVTGSYSTSPSSPTYGFIREADGSFITGIRDPDAALYTDCRGINSRGWVVGFYGVNFGGDPYGFLYVPPSAFINYNVPGAAETYFTGINDRGRITGYYRTSDSAYHGMILQVVE